MNHLERVRRADPAELAKLLTEMIDEFICPLTDKDGADMTLDCANAILAWLNDTEAKGERHDA